MQEPALIPELYCTDFEKSCAFYCDILGFNILYAREEEKFAKLEREGAEIMLEQLVHENGRRWISDTLEKPFGRGVNFQIRVSDVSMLYKKVQNSSFETFLDLEEKWYRMIDKEVGNKQFVVSDPDGYLLRFFEDLGERPI